MMPEVIGELKELRAAPTVADLCARFEEVHLPRKRRLTAQGYRYEIAADVHPAPGKLKVAAVTYADIDKLHRDISRRAPYQANRVLALLPKMFTLSIRWGMRTDNPSKGVERNAEEKRKRYMTGDELRRLTAALDRYDNQQAANVIRLLLLTGARKGEVLAARWDQFDLGAGIWTKSGSTVKQRTTHIASLCSPARDLLLALHKDRRRDSDYVFPSDRADDGHQHDITGAWTPVCRDHRATRP